MATDIELFIGTSQDFLLSFKVKKTDEDKFVLERFIAHRCHNGQIICMATCGRYLATGGGDDRIVIIDLKLNRDVHEIVRHEGSINSLSFTNKGSDLLSGSEDGRLVATAVGSWKPVNIWKKPHTGKGVLKVCLHNSDKFALTLGKDGTLRGWDMFHGTQIKTFNTKDLSLANITLDNVVLCPNGNTFAISGAKTVSVISLVHDEPYDELTLNSPVTSMCWLDDENLLIGMENGSIEWTNINKSQHVNLPNIHPRRIKDMHHMNGFLGTISSNGTISLWAVSNKKLTLICSTTDDSIRPTCIKLIDTTENRYKEATAVNAVPLKENPPRNAKKSRPITTTGKVVVETDANDHQSNGILSSNTPSDRKLVRSADDTEPGKPKKNNKRTNSDIEIETPSETKSKRTKKIVSPTFTRTLTPKSVTPTLAPKSVTSIKSQKKKKQETTPKKTLQRPIVVRSPNSDDDFETPQKKKVIAKTVGKIELSATKAKQRKSNGKEASPNISVGSGTPATKAKQMSTNIPIVSEKKSQKKSQVSSTPLAGGTSIQNNDTQSSTPLSRPASTQKRGSSLKKRRLAKLDLNKTEPTHDMATRNKRKYSM